MSSLAVVLLPSVPASALVIQGTISGTVTGPDGAPLSGIDVLFFGNSTGLTPGATDATGHYSLQVDPDSGTVMFYDESGTYANEVWDNATRFEDATPVDVTSGQVTDASAALALAAHITGRVTDTAGDPVPDVWVDGYTNDGTSWVPAELAGGYTDANGDYDFSGAPGTYRLEFTADSGAYLSEFYDDAHTVEAATSVDAGADAPASGVDVVLAPAATVSGTVTLPSGADPADTDGQIQVVDTATGDVAGSTWLDPGTETAPHSRTYPWTVGDLPAGDYRVEFAHQDGWSTSEAEFYDDQPESAGPQSAAAVSLTSGEQRTGVDATLRAGGTISGRLVDGTGAPIAGCEVIAFRPDDARVRRLGTSAADGSFVVTGLSSGDYGLAVEDYDGSTDNLCPSLEYYTNENGDLSPSYAGLKPVSAPPGTNHAMSATLVYGGDVPSQTTTPTITNTAPPAIVGIPRVGQALSAYAGAWDSGSGAPTTALQWLRNGAPVPGATGASYLLGADDLGAQITLQVTATRDGYAPAQRTSAPSGPVSAGILSLTGVPRMLGTLKVGKTLTALAPTSSPVATSVRFQWLRNGVAIKGLAAKRAKYRLVRADRGKRISVRVTALAPGYAPVASIARKAGKVR
jgi:hypothetical protein